MYIPLYNYKQKGDEGDDDDFLKFFRLNFLGGFPVQPGGEEPQGDWDGGAGAV